MPEIRTMLKLLLQTSIISLKTIITNIYLIINLSENIFLGSLRPVMNGYI